MSISYGLYSAVSGLHVNGDGLAVIANNIANANTKAFKADRAEFQDMLAVSLNENSQLGRGARLRNITTQYTQGALTATGGLTDLAVQGDGFFILKNSTIDQGSSSGYLYTRQGSMRFDKDGLLTDSIGKPLQGYMADDHGRLATHTSNIELISNIVPPRATGVLNVVLNLDVRDTAPKVEFSPEKIRDSTNFVTSATVYDNYGAGHQCDLYLRRSEDLSKNEWDWYATFNPRELGQEPQVNSVGEIIPIIAAQGKVEFDIGGNPILPFQDNYGHNTFIDTQAKSDAFDFQFAGGAKPQKIQFNFGPQIGEDGSVGLQGSTSMAAQSGLAFVSQDGYESGNLKSLRFTQDGMIHGVYTNGLDRRLAALAIAVFSNNHGLEKVGNNNYSAAPTAGAPRFGLAEAGSRGSVFSASLEESNVDLAQEFVNMITTQRAFQANSRTVTTSDTMLEEILNLKR